MKKSFFLIFLCKIILLQLFILPVAANASPKIHSITEAEGYIVVLTDDQALYFDKRSNRFRSVEDNEGELDKMYYISGEFFLASTAKQEVYKLNSPDFLYFSFAVEGARAVWMDYTGLDFPVLYQKNDATGYFLQWYDGAQSSATVSLPVDDFLHITTYVDNSVLLFGKEALYQIFADGTQKILQTGIASQPDLWQDIENLHFDTDGQKLYYCKNDLAYTLDKELQEIQLAKLHMSGFSANEYLMRAIGKQLYIAYYGNAELELKKVPLP